MITCMKCGKSYEKQPGVVCGYAPVDEDGAVAGIACTSSLWHILPEAVEVPAPADSEPAAPAPMSKRR